MEYYDKSRCVSIIGNLINIKGLTDKPTIVFIDLDSVVSPLLHDNFIFDYDNQQFINDIIRTIIGGFNNDYSNHIYYVAMYSTSKSFMKGYIDDWDKGKDNLKKNFIKSINTIISRVVDILKELSNCTCINTYNIDTFYVPKTFSGEVFGKGMEKLVVSRDIFQIVNLEDVDDNFSVWDGTHLYRDLRNHNSSIIGKFPNFMVRTYLGIVGDKGKQTKKYRGKKGIGKGKFMKYALEDGPCEYKDNIIRLHHKYARKSKHYKRLIDEIKGRNLDTKFIDKTGMSMEDMVSELNESLNTPIVDGKYSVDLEFNGVDNEYKLLNPHTFVISDHILTSYPQGFKLHIELDVNKCEELFLYIYNHDGLLTGTPIRYN